ncbi:MAG: molecular chaperone HscB [Bacteroidia bacterium]|jgi:molecular chaperone HscB
MAQNHFEHFGLPISFQLDLDALRKAFLRITRTSHPDFFAGDEKEYDAALVRSSYNNLANKVLYDERMRIAYVLELKGVGVGQDDKLDPMFLMEMMDWNDRIEEVEQSTDGADTKALQRDFNDMMLEFTQELHEAMKRCDEAENEAALLEIKNIYLKQKYLLRLNESINTFAPH